MKFYLYSQIFFIIKNLFLLIFISPFSLHDELGLPEISCNIIQSQSAVLVFFSVSSHQKICPMLNVPHSKRRHYQLLPARPLYLINVIPLFLTILTRELYSIIQDIFYESFYLIRMEFYINIFTKLIQINDICCRHCSALTLSPVMSSLYLHISRTAN